MAKTLDEGFSTFLSWLTPTGTESANAKSHRASIKTRLENDFNMKRFFRTGSFGNATSISSYSDVDYFASIPRDNLKQDSNSTLRALKKSLDERFPNTGVYIDAPAVVVPFGNEPSESTEIVPADFLNREYDCSTYEIPDGSGGWMKASPELHKLYVDNRDSDLNKKVKPLIRFLKAWKYYRNVPISSFYLEMYVSVYAKGEKSVIYSIDLHNIFEKLQSGELSFISDPMGVSGYIRACKTDEDENKALVEIKNAVRRANNARTAEKEGDISNAFYWWNLVFNDCFPSF